jgi:carboxymethylenebutenolidase
MCFDLDSRPPIDPIAGGSLDAGPVTLRASDGVEFRAFGARPAAPTGAGILVLPDVRGLHPYYEELALRFAEHGIAAVAIDYFGPTAGPHPRDSDFDHAPHLEKITWSHLKAAIEAGVSHLRSEAGGSPRSTLVTGFCMGGRLASLSATLGLGFAGAIPFYGWPVGPWRADVPAPADLASKIECDVLAIYGEADHAIPEEARAAYDGALDEAGVEHRTIVYPNAPHGFFDKKAEDFADASASAWNEMLTFIRRHTAGQPFAAARGGKASS